MTSNTINAKCVTRRITTWNTDRNCVAAGGNVGKIVRIAAGQVNGG